MRIRSNKIQSRPKGRILAFALLASFLVGTIYLALNKYTGIKKPDGSTTVEDTLKASYEGSLIEIDLKADAYQQLENKRKEAIKKGLLFSSKEDLVDAELRIDNELFPCKIRLKGDLLDHLQGDKWSFRIMLKNGKKWKGMRTFSIHNSKARSHTAEWVMHKLYAKEGILTPAYDFVQVKLNDKDLGIYAYEEHFENHLITKTGREVGPILKHSDDAYWENVNAKLDPFPWIEASSIELFNKRNKDNPQFIQAYEKGKAVLNEFLKGSIPASEVFDIELMGKYYALIDLTHATHAQLFTNIRFYANPLSGKLEPIGYDCFGDHLSNVTPRWIATGEGFNSRKSKIEAYEKGNVYLWHLFQDQTFYKAYLKHLSRLTSDTHFNSIKSNFQQQRDARAKYIRKDSSYRNFQPNWDKLFSKLKYTQKKIQPKSNLSLKAYHTNTSSQKLNVQSFHNFPLEVVGVGSETRIIDSLSEVVILEAYDYKIPVRTYEINIEGEASHIYFRTLGLQQIHKEQISKESLPLFKPATPQDHRALSSFPFLSILGQDVIIAPGTHTIQYPLIIPSDKRLIVSSGSTLIFQEGGLLISYGAVVALGTPLNPINFIGTKQTSAGILLSESSVNSKFTYCNFEMLSGIKYSRIDSRGSVTSYKTEASFINCTFNHLDGEIGLFSSFSKLELKNCSFEKSQGSSIIGKYSALTIDDSKIIQSGINAIEIHSGSLRASNILIDEALNQALHFTEGVDAFGYNIKVSNSYQGLYASQHAWVELVNYSNQQLQRGIEVRGLEDPKTHVSIKSFSAKDVEHLYLIKPGIEISVNGKTQTAK